MITELYGGVWSYAETHIIIIPTNRLGVMGAGLALQAKSRYSGIQTAYQQALSTMDDKGLPWRDDNYPSVIYRDATTISELREVLGHLSKLAGGPFVLPEMGCGLGGQRWEQTKYLYAIFEPLETEWFIIHPVKMYTGLLR